MNVSYQKFMVKNHIYMCISDNSSSTPPQKVISMWRNDGAQCYLRRIHQEDTMILNTYALNFDVLHFIKQTLLNIKGQLNLEVIIESDKSTLFSSIDRTFRQKSPKITQT
jgi:hypothetical protein